VHIHATSASALPAISKPISPSSPRRANELLREGAARAIGGYRQHRVQAILVVTSVAFAFVLLVAAGLLLRSFSRLIATDSGVRAANVLTLEVTLPYAGYNNAARIRSFYRALHDRLLAIPGVRAASISSDLPVKFDGERRVFTPDGSSAEGIPPSVAVTWVQGNYFATRSGRGAARRVDQGARNSR
jgi:putative ABC transport system permease protein